jgi:hypothetical protein
VKESIHISESVRSQPDFGSMSTWLNPENTIWIIAVERRKDDTPIEEKSCKQGGNTIIPKVTPAINANTKYSQYTPGSLMAYQKESENSGHKLTVENIDRHSDRNGSKHTSTREILVEWE